MFSQRVYQGLLKTNAEIGVSLELRNEMQDPMRVISGFTLPEILVHSAVERSPSPWNLRSRQFKMFGTTQHVKPAAVRTPPRRLR